MILIPSVLIQNLKDFVTFYNKWNIDTINPLPSDNVRSIKRMPIPIVAPLFL